MVHWNPRLAAGPAPRAKADPVARLTSELERERTKVKRVREELKQTKDAAAKPVEDGLETIT